MGQLPWPYQEAPGVKLPWPEPGELLEGRFDRDVQTVKCSCGGECEPKSCTPPEGLYGCSRSDNCCSRAFVCSTCGKRYVARLLAPDDCEEEYDDGDA